jgi:hypothetical protein
VNAADLFHLGIIATDPDATRAELTGLLGYRWSAEMAAPITVTLPTGEAPVDITVDIRCAYSVTEPRVEVVQAIPGTFWTPSAGIHHLGYWSDDVAADAADLEERGWQREVARTNPDGALFFTFHVNAAGLRVELVDRRAKPMMEQAFSRPAES